MTPSEPPASSIESSARSESQTLRLHRLHPSTLLFRIGRMVRALIIPALVVYFAASESTWENWMLALFVPSLIFALIRYFTLRYGFTNDELIVRSGLIFRNERHIPFERIQNIDLTQNPVHRLLGVADVRLETAGGGEPEALLQVLSFDAVSEMRRRIFADRPATHSIGAAPTSVDESASLDAAGPAPKSSVSQRRLLLQIPAAELIKLGLISHRGTVLIAVLFGLAWEFNLFERIDYESAYETWLAGLTQTVQIWLGVGALLLAILLLRVLSAAWMILRFHGYRLERHGNDLRLEGGLLTRWSATIPRRRVQFVSVRQGLVQRWLNCASIRIETAGGHGGGDHDDQLSSVSRRWFVPILPKQMVVDILPELRDGLQLEDLQWQPLAPRARVRIIRLSIIVSLLLSAAIALVLGWWWAISAVVFVPAALVYANLLARRIGYARIPQGMVYRSGVWTQIVSVTFFDKVQVVRVAETPFDRRWRMASLRIDTAGAGPAGHVVSIPFLTRAVAMDLLHELSARAQRSDFRL